MALGPVVRYHQFARLLAEDAYPSWDNPDPAAFMFVLCNNNYTPSPIHTTYGALVGFAITAGSGAPINVPGRSIVNSTTDITKVDYKFTSANFGTVTVPVKYLICVIPAVAGVIDNAARLCWYVDLDDSSPTAELPAGTDINVIAVNDIMGSLG